MRFVKRLRERIARWLAPWNFPEEGFVYVRTRIRGKEYGLGIMLGGDWPRNAKMVRALWRSGENLLQEHDALDPNLRPENAAK